MELLEGPLKRKRINLARRHLGKIDSLIDIGCGKDAALLNSLKDSRIEDRAGIDIEVEPRYRKGFILVRMDITKTSLPFPKERFDAATMLAVLEHIAPEDRQKVVNEVARVIKPQGTIFITTPAPSSGSILQAMSKIGLVSRKQLLGHKRPLTPQEARDLLHEAKLQEIRHGYFEIGLNMWATATKQPKQNPKSL